MRLLEPAYHLKKMDGMGWQFVLSDEMQGITARLDEILSTPQSRGRLCAALRKFLKQHPNHVEALHYYAMCKLDEGKALDAFAFSSAAVAEARRAFPEGFRMENDCLPGGWHSNRFFLRALYGLMISQHATGQVSAAIDTAQDLMGCESQDRNGARLLLPLYLLEENREREALALFRQEQFAGTFGTTEYLHALALIRCNRSEEALEVLSTCIEYYPKLAQYLLHPELPMPENESKFGGVVTCSDYEAWSAALDQRAEWAWTEGALDILAAFTDRTSN